jgi:hypothetical protein
LVLGVSVGSAIKFISVSDMNFGELPSEGDHPANPGPAAAANFSVGPCAAEPFSLLPRSLEKRLPHLKNGIRLSRPI